jgi:hypothetical protein
MGKKSDLVNARQVCHGELNKNNSENIEIEIDPDYLKEKEQDFFEKTALELYKELQEYVNDGSWPLCEYLDLNSVNQYLHFTLQ